MNIPMYIPYPGRGYLWNWIKRYEKRLKWEKDLKPTTAMGNIMECRCNMDTFEAYRMTRDVMGHIRPFVSGELEVDK